MNNKIKIAIVEDQLENIEILQYFFANKSEAYEIKYIAQNGEDARRILKNEDIDLALLDIDLGNETIFDVLNDLAFERLSFPLIFVTAHGTFENALKAIRFSCLNFITKPIDFEELKQTLNQVENVGLLSDESQIQVLLEILKSKNDKPNKIGIALSKGVIQFLECDEIAYILADDTIATIITKGNKKFRSTKNLGYYAKLLGGHNDFIRIHKSTLVNRAQIHKLNPRNRLIIMKNDENLEISKRRLKEVQMALEK